jgi:hypothetical protein
LEILYTTMVALGVPAVIHVPRQEEHA